MTICDNCGNSYAKIQHISKRHRNGATLLVIENVPIISCLKCGESYLAAETLHEIESPKQSQLGVVKAFG